MTRRNRKAAVRPMSARRCLRCPAIVRHLDGLLCRRCQHADDKQQPRRDRQ